MGEQCLFVSIWGPWGMKWTITRPMGFWSPAGTLATLQKRGQSCFSCFSPLCDDAKSLDLSGDQRNRSFITSSAHQGYFPSILGYVHFFTQSSVRRASEAGSYMGNRRKGDPGLLRLHRAAGGGGGSLKTERSLELSTRIRKRRHWSLPVFGMNTHIQRGFLNMTEMNW